MRTEIDPSLLTTLDGTAEALLLGWLIKCQEHPAYIAAASSGVSHEFAGVGSPNPAKQTAEVHVQDFGASLQWIPQEDSAMPSFVLSFFEHNRGDGLLRHYDLHPFRFELMEFPITMDTLELMIYNLAGCTFRHYAFSTIEHLKKNVNHLGLVQGFVGFEPKADQE